MKPLRETRIHLEFLLRSSKPFSLKDQFRDKRLRFYKLLDLMWRVFLEVTVLESFTFAWIFKVACWGGNFFYPKFFFFHKLKHFPFFIHLLWLILLGLLSLILGVTYLGFKLNLFFSVHPQWVFLFINCNVVCGLFFADNENKGAMQNTCVLFEKCPRLCNSFRVMWFLPGLYVYIFT